MIDNPDEFNPIGKWDKRYAEVIQCAQYGSEDSYVFACALLQGLNVVEDWGCGLGYARSFFQKDVYRGIDGSNSKFCDEIGDVVTRKSSPDGILLRHVLEHNLKWGDLLKNAISCVQKRLVIVVFTNLVKATHYAWDKEGIPCIEFKPEDIEQFLNGFRWVRASVLNDTIWLVDKIPS